MKSPDTRNLSILFQKGFLWGVMLGLALVLLGRFLVPTTDLLSVGAACLVLIVYGLVGYFVSPKIDPDVLVLVGVFGLLAGAVFAGEILLEYVLLPKDNTGWGVIEFGSVLALFFISGLVAAYRSKRMRVGVLASLGTAMLSSLIWLIFILLTFYGFRGTARQGLVFMAEGDYADFARSGMKDFNTFVMEDFLGAGFFHLLLAPLFAAILGWIGALLGKGMVRFVSNRIGN
jgi:hypothetical protein